MRHLIVLIMAVVLLVIGNFSICMAAGDEYYPPVEFDPAMQALFQEALAEREAGNFSSAIESFQTVLSNQPMLHRARLELAVAYYDSYNYQKAIRHAERVLEDPNTPANVRVAVLAFLAQVKKDAEGTEVAKEYWSMPFQFSFIYDSNVNVGPDSQIVDNFDLGEGVEAQSDSGTVIYTGLNHTVQTGKQFKVRQRNTSLLWQSGLHVYQRNYLDEHKYDTDVYTFRTGPTLISRGNWRANLNFQGDWIRYGEDDLAFYSYILPTFTMHLSDAFEITLDGTASNRDYKGQYADDGRNGVYLAGQFSAGYTFGKDRLGLKTGLKYFNENASDDQYGNDGISVFAGCNYRLFGKSNLFAMVTWMAREYKGRASDFDKFKKDEDGNYLFDGEDPIVDEENRIRDEDKFTYTAGFNYTLEKAGWLTDWKLEGKVIFEENDANIGAFDYDRTQGLVTISHRFR